MSGLAALERPVTTFSASIEDYPAAMEWSDDGQYLAVASTSGRIWLFDLNLATCVHEWRAHQHGLHQLAWQPRQPRLASSGQDGQVRVWDIIRAGGVELAYEHAAGKSWVEQLAWSPDGRHLAFAAGNEVQVIPDKGDDRHVYHHDGSTVSALAWRPKGAQLAIAGYGGIRTWQFPFDTESVRSYPWKGAMLNCSWSPDASIIAAGCQDNSVHFWRTRSGEDAMMSGFASKPMHIAWSRNGRWLVTADAGIIACWPFDKRGPEGREPLELKFHESRITTLQFSARSGHLAVACEAGTISIWHRLVVDTMPAVSWQLDGSRKCAVEYVRWSPGKMPGRLAVINRDGELRVSALSTVAER